MWGADFYLNTKKQPDESLCLPVWDKHAFAFDQPTTVTDGIIKITYLQDSL